MKKIKKLLATLMLVALVIPTGISAVPVKAAGVCNSPEEVTRLLEDMAPIYRAKFWNANLSSAVLQSAVDNGYSDPYRNIEMGERRRALGLTDNPGDSSNNFNGWTTCTGFARYVFYLLFSTKLPSYDTLVRNPAAYNVTVYSASDLKNGFTLQAGDFFYEHSPHAAVVSKNVNGKVHVVEANVNNPQYTPITGQKYNNYINWDNPASNADGYWGYRYSYGASHNNDTLVNTIIKNNGYIVRHNFAGSSQNTSPNPAPAASALSINGVSAIGTIKEGKTYPINGTVTSNYSLTEVTGIIAYTNGNSIYSKSVNPGKTSYTLKYSKIDSAMLFNYLAPGEYIYKVIARDSAGGYKENSQTFRIEGSQPASTLSISGVSAIGTIKEGKTYPIDGTVSSNYNLTDVTGTIYDANGNTIYTNSVNPGKTSYTLKYSKIDNAMLFNYLAPGQYRYKVSASDAAGGYQENSQNFTIEGRNDDAQKAREEEERRRAQEEEARKRAEEERARAEEAARAAEEAARATEEAAKAEQNNSGSSSDNNGVIILPDHENESISMSGSTGKYDLHLARSSSTQTFTAADNRLTIITRGQVEDLVNGGIRTDASRHFIMYLYDVTNGREEYVDGYYANCDNIEGGLEFDVLAGHRYKIRFETEGLKYNEAVIGDGHAYPIR